MLGRMTTTTPPSKLRLPPALPLWTLLMPVLSLLTLAGIWGQSLAGLGIAAAALALGAAVMSAVHHAEVVAHKVGEPYGTLVLAVAVTVIEVALIVSLMLAGGAGATALARDTVYAAIMIVSNGVVGLCLLVGGVRHRVVAFRVEGTSPSLAVLVALSGLTLVLPAFTTSSPGPTLTGTQLAFAGVASLVLYGAFVFVQTVRHRDYFLPLGAGDDEHSHAEPPSTRVAWAALGMMLVCLVAVVGLAKALAPNIEAAVHDIGAPAALVGVIVALMVLLPETAAAVRAAAHNRLQTSLNLALGSALASIGLTIPAVALLSLWFPHPLALGLAPKELVMLGLTFVISTITLAGGRATVLHGAVHLVLFAAFLFLAVVP
jgi:Ca2+:H+ antiporter